MKINRTKEALNPQYVFLTGLSGAGKSVLGPLLAKSLGATFIDLDKTIERECGSSISDIFANSGERRFRKFETSVLKGLLSNRVTGRRRAKVIALGGGTLISKQNRKLVKKNGVLVWLQVSCAIAAERLHSKTDRPLARSASGNSLSRNELLLRLRELLRTRKSGFMEADIRVRTTGKSVACVRIETIRKIHLLG